MPKINILIICAGNTCRSVMAGRYLAMKAGSAVKVTTRGLRPGEEVPEEVFTALAPLGIGRFNHAAQEVTVTDIETADRIFVMEKPHQTELEQMFWQARGKTELLDGALEIADPFGLGPAAYKAALAQIQTAADRILKELLQGD